MKLTPEICLVPISRGWAQNPNHETKKTGPAYEMAILEAREWKAIIDIIIHQADKYDLEKTTI